MVLTMLSRTAARAALATRLPAPATRSLSTTVVKFGGYDFNMGVRLRLSVDQHRLFSTHVIPFRKIFGKGEPLNSF